MTNNTKTKPLDLLLQARIESKIYLIRGKRVMIDKDLAELYEVKTKIFNQAVKRNNKRFPDDFMFQLTKEEVKEFLRSQFVTLKGDSILNIFLMLLHRKVLPCFPVY